MLVEEGKGFGFVRKLVEEEARNCIMQENGASSSVPKLPTRRILDMASSCNRSSEIKAGKTQCRSSGKDDKGEAEVGSARHGGNLSDPQMAGESQGKETMREGLIQSDGNGEMGPSTGCSACGLEMQNVHRLKKDSALRLCCTSCVLYSYQGMYCCQCFYVYPDPGQLGDPALWLTCSKCQRFCHMECAQENGLPMDTFFFACQYCFLDPASECQPASSTLKRPRSQSLSDQETLAAAQIVAIFAVKEAKDAKVRARACAAAAAKAAKLAKSALDVAYRAGLEEMRWRHEASRQNFVAAAPMNQGLRKLQMGSYIGNGRAQQATTGLNDKKMFMPHYQRVFGKSLGSSSCDPDSSKTAATNLSHHQRRVLPPVVSPDATGARFVPSHIGQKLASPSHFAHKDFHPVCASNGSGQHGSSSSLPKEQRFTIASENGVVDASPESLFEGSTLLGTPTADTATHTATTERNENLPHDTSVVEIVSDEEGVDDYVYVEELLITENLEKDGDVSISLAVQTQNPSTLVPQEGVLAFGKETNPDCMNKAASLAHNHQLVAASELATHTGQPPGATLAVSSQSGTPGACTLPKEYENAANPVFQ